MTDRVTDSAAAHATSAELAVRDWLLVGLSFATGIYEAICFLTFGKVFTAAQTGNLVLLGIGVAGTKEPAGPNPVTVVISLAAFAVGVAVAIPILKAFDGDRETEDNKVFDAWPRRVSIALAIALILQVGFLVVWATAASPASLAYILMALAAGAFLGDLMLRHAHPYAPVVPAVVTAVVIAIAWVALKPRATAGPAGEQGLPVPQAVK
jgi:uncharacterized membrane protein YoaK (UPF0700 family)